MTFSVRILLDHPVVDVVVAPLPPPVDGDDGADDGDGDEDPGEHGNDDHEDAQRDAVSVVIIGGATCKKLEWHRSRRLREPHAGSRILGQACLGIRPIC